MLEKENQHTNRTERPFKIPYIDEDWIMGHVCEPKNLTEMIPVVLNEKDKFKNDRKYWAEQSGWKFDGKNCDRLLRMIENFMVNGVKNQIEDIR